MLSPLAHCYFYFEYVIIITGTAFRRESRLSLHSLSLSLVCYLTLFAETETCVTEEEYAECSHGRDDKIEIFYRVSPPARRVAPAPPPRYTADGSAWFHMHCNLASRDAIRIDEHYLRVSVR